MHLNLVKLALSLHCGEQLKLPVSQQKWNCGHKLPIETKAQPVPQMTTKSHKNNAESAERVKQRQREGTELNKGTVREQTRASPSEKVTFDPSAKTERMRSHRVAEKGKEGKEVQVIYQWTLFSCNSSEARTRKRPGVGNTGGVKCSALMWSEVNYFTFVLQGEDKEVRAGCCACHGVIALVLTAAGRFCGRGEKGDDQGRQADRKRNTERKCSKQARGSIRVGQRERFFFFTNKCVWRLCFEP